MKIVQFEPEDIRANKACAAVGYLLFFVPLLACGDSKLGKFCANQGLIIWLVCIAANIVAGIISGLPLIGWLLNAARWIANLAIAGVTICCMERLLIRNEATELPYIGVFSLIR